MRVTQDPELQQLVHGAAGRHATNAMHLAPNKRFQRPYKSVMAGPPEGRVPAIHVRKQN
jgi:hypothetical protein